MATKKIVVIEVSKIFLINNSKTKNRIIISIKIIHNNMIIIIIILIIILFKVIFYLRGLANQVKSNMLKVLLL